MFKKQHISDLAEGIIQSYAQVFFSGNRYFAFLLLFVSFFDLNAGLSGLIAVLIANGLAWLMGYNQNNIRQGFYGFNALLVGLGFGVYYQPGLAFFLVLFFISAFTLFLTLFFEGMVSKHGLPFLSLSFMAGIWTVILAGRQFGMLETSEEGIYLMNEMHQLGGPLAVQVYYWFSNLSLPGFLVVYFRSLGAIFFQYHLFAGLIIAIGLLYHSRISFLMSLIGFSSAYLFYMFTGARIEELSYYYIGFNFILTAIALGGIFLIPDRYSVVSVIALVPFIAMMITAFGVFFWQFQLSIYSLPFNLVVLLFLYVLRFRIRSQRNPQIVQVQHFSPERNLYAHRNYDQRFEDGKFMSIGLPVWGEWFVSQGHSGEHTHKNDWRHAWDFEIQDDHGLSYKNSGFSPEDYYCYGKPVMAPAAAMVYDILDGIVDNSVGDMNMEHNWGNTIILKHAEGLFTKLCHLKKDSVQVHIGQQVAKGQAMAQVGNSGRSPVPHLHMQVQRTPFIGSKTMEYPLNDYILIGDGAPRLKTYSIPQKNQKLSTLPFDENISKAFHFIPGQQIKGLWSNQDIETNFIWEVHSDSYNNQWLYCKETGSKAYFYMLEGMFSFTWFEGKRKSALFWFYLSCFKMVSGFMTGLEVEESLPETVILPQWLKPLQDILAPFWVFSKAEYKLYYLKQSDNFTESRTTLKGTVTQKAFRKTIRHYEWNCIISNNMISQIAFSKDNRIQFNAESYST